MEQTGCTEFARAAGIASTHVLQLILFLPRPPRPRSGRFQAKQRKMRRGRRQFRADSGSMHVVEAAPLARVAGGGVLVSGKSSHVYLVFEEVTSGSAWGVLLRSPTHSNASSPMHDGKFLFKNM